MLATIVQLSCGDPIVSGGAYQEPLVTIVGYTQSSSGSIGVASPRVTVIWVDPLGTVADVPAPENTVNFTDGTSGAFELQLFAPPPPAAGIATVASESSAVTFAFGELVLYDDIDGDGALTISANNEIVGPDTYRGASGQYVLLYVESPAPSGAAVLWSALEGPAGYRLGLVDCAVFGQPLISAVDFDSTTVELGIVPATAQLPYLRTCLVSHVAGGP